MAIPKIEAFSWHDNHVVASSFLAPTYEPHLINSPAHEAPVTRRLHRLPRLRPLHQPDVTRKTRRTSAVTPHLLAFSSLFLRSALVIFEFVGVRRRSSRTLDRSHCLHPFLIFRQYRTAAVAVSRPFTMYIDPLSLHKGSVQTLELFLCLF